MTARKKTSSIWIPGIAREWWISLPRRGAVVTIVAMSAALLLAAAGCTFPGSDRSEFDPLDRFYTIDDDGVERIRKSRETPVLGWLTERGLDFLDMGSARVSFGPGLRAHVRVTKLAQIGIGKLGAAEVTTMGFTFPLYKLGFLKREGGLWEERSHEIGISLLYYYHVIGEPLGGNKTTFSPEDRGFWEIGAALHWLLIGAEAELRPLEMLDFAFGFFGMDLMDDDEIYRDPDFLEDENGG